MTPPDAPGYGYHEAVRDEPSSKLRPVLVSACLLGRECRYDGGHCSSEPLREALASRAETPVAFCPEEEGGLGTPRPAAWIEAGGATAALAGESRVVTESGADVTAEFLAGAEGALAACREHGIERAYLKERSPSCGTTNTYVGGELVEGSGVTAELLRREGIETVSNEELPPQ